MAELLDCGSPLPLFATSWLLPTNQRNSMRADLLKDASRIVVKLGTGVLTDSKKQPDLAQMEQLVAQIAQLRQLGHEVVLVSSGAVGAGMGLLKHERRP